ncbi:Hypothetical predicted protein [Octopus vulgaris]|uniref:Uncharacterized protein n=1 Tax=Octopus vulgaris TaxID=6645 RepID=A0AA36BCF8_OCTVU|nr:Hypothetical predicted protein [Octopus vulgaris]
MFSTGLVQLGSTTGASTGDDIYASSPLTSLKIGVDLKQTLCRSTDGTTQTTGSKAAGTTTLKKKKQLKAVDAKHIILFMASLHWKVLYCEI